MVDTTVNPQRLCSLSTSLILLSILFQVAQLQTHSHFQTIKCTRISTIGADEKATICLIQINLKRKDGSQCPLPFAFSPSSCLICGLYAQRLSHQYAKGDGAVNQKEPGISMPSLTSYAVPERHHSRLSWQTKKALPEQVLKGLLHLYS